MTDGEVEVLQRNTGGRPGILEIGVTQRHGTRERQSGLASDLGTPSFRAISTCMTFDPITHLQSWHYCL